MNMIKRLGMVGAVALSSSVLCAGDDANASSVNEPPAASLAYTSNDTIVLQALDFLKSGKFKEAETLLAASTDQINAPALRARSETMDIIHRIRHGYALDAAELLAKIREKIPDASAGEVDRWAKESGARYRMINGRKLFFRREPQNIFLFSEEAKHRRAQAGNAPAEPSWNLLDHLKAVADEADRTGHVEVQPVHHTLTHTLTIRANTPGVKAGSTVRVWLPYPQEYRQQRNVRLISASPKEKLIAPSAVEGNPVTGGAQRTVYFEQQVADPSKPLEFKLVFDYVSSAYYPKLDEAKVQPLPPDWNGACLSERPPHIVFTPEIRSEVAGIIGQETNALAKARNIFHWVSANVIWNAEDEYCIVPSIALKGFTAQARRLRRPKHRVYYHVPHRWHPGTLAERIRDPAR